MNDLLGSWMLRLRAERKSPNTLRTYDSGVRSFMRWCVNNNRKMELTSGNVSEFLAHYLDEGAAPYTVRARYQALTRFGRWLAQEGETDSYLLDGLKPPKVDDPVVPVLNPEEIKALLDACKGTQFQDRRDDAIVRLMLETGSRSGEIVLMAVTDVDVREGLAVIQRGKGGKGRVVPFGPQTAVSIDRYLRERKQHRLVVSSPALWLGTRGRGFGYPALHQALTVRARRAGIQGFHPHVLRHTFADRWLDAGGGEGSLMAVAGWSTRNMLDRYGRARKNARAVDEARRLNLGDI